AHPRRRRLALSDERPPVGGDDPRSGRRELWDAARIVANRLDLLGAIRYELPKPTTAYVYMCELDRLSWWYELPDKNKCAELGVFARLPRPIASEAVEIVLEAALRARRTGLR